jgi:hypothetical protein
VAGEWGCLILASQPKGYASKADNFSASGIGH